MTQTEVFPNHMTLKCKLVIELDVLLKKVACALLCVTINFLKRGHVAETWESFSQLARGNYRDFNSCSLESGASFSCMVSHG